MARRLTLTSGQLTLLTSCYVVLALNGAFWTKLNLIVQPASPAEWLFFAALAAMLVAILDAILSLSAYPLLLRPIAAALVILSATIAYFQAEFGTLIDANMVRNIVETDASEAFDFASWGLLVHIALLGIVPAAFIAWVPITWKPATHIVFANLARSSAAGTIAAVLIFAFFANFAGVFRENRSLLFMLVPSNVIAASSKYFFNSKEPSAPRIVRSFGADARIDTAAATTSARPLVTVLVVGETARAANFSLNGYERPTNPRLAKVDQLLNFRHVTSCGTDTAHSLPCMFSGVTAAEFTVAKGAEQENLLDILQRSGLDVLWRDNQSGCKGVCRRVPTEMLTRMNGKPFYAEMVTHDEVLLHGLAPKLEAMKRGGVVVLHMVGSHGPAYFRRVPPEFARFQPTCQSRQFSNCTNPQIVNSYDNTILYTDHVLAELIELLRATEARGFDTAMLYVSDHGESLGEKGLYLHGMPRALAPKEQIQIPMMWWASPSALMRFGIDMECAQEVAATKPLSHDNLFHTVLGMHAVQTRLYDERLDILHRCRTHRKVPM
jgi:lipid A ethanolaminephosphotransferase